MKLALAAAAAATLALVSAAHAQGNPEVWEDYGTYVDNIYREQIDKLVGENAGLREEIARLERELEEAGSGAYDPVTTSLEDGRITYHVESLPDYSTYDISHFERFLDRNFAGHNIVRVDDIEDADYSIIWVRDYGTEYIGRAYQWVASIGLGSSDCWYWRHFDDDTITYTIWHELGHLVGFGHSTDTSNIMHEIANYTKYGRDVEFDDVIYGGWYQLVPFCRGGTMYFEFEGDKKYGTFEIAVLGPDDDPDEFDFAGGYYEGCGGPAEVWDSHSAECHVPEGAQIILVNLKDEPVWITGHVEDRTAYPVPILEWDPEAYEHDPGNLQRITSILG